MPFFRSKRKSKSETGKRAEVGKTLNQPQPPTDFDPLIAPHEDLVKYGFPRRPSKALTPKLRTLWERHVSSHPRFVASSTKPLSDFWTNSAAKQQPAGGIRELNVANPSWTGAILTSPPEGQFYDVISATWIVPNVGIPPASAFPNGVIPDGNYTVNMWIGFDMNQGALDPGLSVGTSTICIVYQGKVVEPSTWTFSWCQWGGLGEGSPVPVSPGDTVTAFACSNKGSNTGVIGMHNVTQGTASPAITVTAQGQDTTFQGANAGWMTGDIYVDTDNPFANFGLTYFSDTVAASRNEEGTVGVEHTLSGSTLLNIVTPTFTSNAVAENDELLMIYSYSAGP